MQRAMTYENNIDTDQEINDRGGLLGSLNVRTTCCSSSADTEQNKLDPGNAGRGFEISHANTTLSTLGNVSHIS